MRFLLLGLLKSENFYKNNKCSLLFLLDSRFRGNDEIGGFQQPPFRDFRKISQAALAAKVGISRQYLCQIESNQRKGSSRILKKIADALGVDVALLI